MFKLTRLTGIAGILTMLFIFLAFNTNTAKAVNLMLPDTIAKFVDPLPNIPIANPGLETNFTMGMYPIQQRMHSGWPLTNMWAYGRSQATAHSPIIIAAIRNIPDTVRWENHLVNPDGTYIVHPFDIDQTIPWANPYGIQPPPMTRYDGPIPTTVHLHGGEVVSEADGHYESWYTPQATNAPVITGPSYDWAGTGTDHQKYIYSNEQPAATIWFHDHAFGLDRQNVMMGLFGGYPIIDPADGIEYIPALGVNTGMIPTLTPYDVPMVVQDRLIDENYQIAYQGTPPNPTVHPIWFPEFFGNINVVNGVIWPYKDVEQTIYRFRIINGSNARFYHFYLSDGMPMYDALSNFTGFAPIPTPFLHIATDGGFLENAAQQFDFTMGPGERNEILIDFSAFPVGTDVYLVNDAPAPFMSGDPVDMNTAMVMKFHVVPITPGYNDAYVRAVVDGTPLKAPVTRPAPTVVRNIVLFEKEGPGGPLAMFLDGVDMSDPRSVVRPTIGTVEQWNFINTTMDAHPMHMHLTQSQILSRQAIRVYDAMMNVDPLGYLAAFMTANPVLPIPYDQNLVQVDYTPYITGPGTPIGAQELKAMKDTWICPSGEVTSILVKWKQENDTPYGFDASTGPGYVWHCHILEHEENAMMRELKPLKPEPAINPAKLVLKLPGLKIQAVGPVVYTNMMPMLDHWADYSGLNNHAVQPNMMNMPMHDGYGIVDKEAIMFMPNPTMASSAYFEIPYNKNITTSSLNETNPVNESKDLYIVFTPRMVDNNLNLDNLNGWRSWYDTKTQAGLQTIFEAGGARSGYNVYTNGSRLVFSVWNSNQTRYFTFPYGSLQAGQPYLAHLEFDALTRKVRVLLNGSPSTSIPFKGLFKDQTDPTGIGAVDGASRFSDGTAGTTGSNSYTGDIGDIFLFNNCDPVQKAQVYAWLNWRYNRGWTYPAVGMPKIADIQEDVIDLPDGEVLAQAYPNPADNSTMIGYNVPSEGNVSLKVYDMFGNHVATVADGVLSAGTYQDFLNTSNLPAGMYTYKLVTGNITESKSFVVVR